MFSVRPRLRWILRAGIVVALAFVAARPLYAAVRLNQSSLAYVSWLGRADVGSVARLEQAAAALARANDATPRPAWGVRLAALDALAQRYQQDAQRRAALPAGTHAIAPCAPPPEDAKPIGIRASRIATESRASGRAAVEWGRENAQPAAAPTIPDALEMLPEGWYCQDGHRFQVTQVTNLVWAGEDIPRFSDPYFFGYSSGPRAAELADVTDNRVETVPVGGLDANVFVLQNLVDSVSNVIVTGRRAVEPDTQYTLSARIRTAQGQPNGGLGIACFGSNATQRDDYYYVTRDAAPQAWTQFTGSFTTSPSTTGCVVLLLNYGKAESVYFDDVTLIKTPDRRL